MRGTDIFGRNSYDTINVTFPYVGINTLDTAVCIGNAVSFSPIINNAASFSYLWNDLYATTSLSLSPQYSGYYWCVISDSSGCTLNSDTSRLFIDSLSLLSLFANDTTICSGNDLAANFGNYTITSLLCLS